MTPTIVCHRWYEMFQKIMCCSWLEICPPWQGQLNMFTLYEENNCNGDCLEQFIIENNMKCLNTLFLKKTGKLWTQTHPNGSKSQVDFILINRKWINSVKNCEAYNTFDYVFSDHRIISCTLNLSLRTNKKFYQLCFR